MIDDDNFILENGGYERYGDYYYEKQWYEDDNYYCEETALIIGPSIPLNNMQSNMPLNMRKK